jgi:tRNA dimethylallyltransferase
MKNIICVISGPTASGKTSTSISLAKLFGGEIVNFDSLLFYREINIGTAKPTDEEKDGVIHHFVDCASVKSPINAADYSKMAIAKINEIHSRGLIAYLVGGSGFYLQAVLKGMYDSQTTPTKVIDKSNKLYDEKGISPFREILKEYDPVSFTRYHENDHYRIRRAVEHFWTNATIFSDEREKMKSKDEQSPELVHNWNVFHAHLDLDKEEHFKIIQKRTNQMLESGLLDEVDKLLVDDFTGAEKPLKSIGYKECFQYRAGILKDLASLEERINISTRQLAKSQRTWFKKVDKSTYNPLFDKLLLEEDFKTFIGVNSDN